MKQPPVLHSSDRRETVGGTREQGWWWWMIPLSIFAFAAFMMLLAVLSLLQKR